MKRDFDKWLSTFRNSIADYNYYVNFDKVYRNVDDIKIELNILNSLIGSKNIKKDFKDLVEKYPEVIKAIPTILAVRENEIFCKDENGEVYYDFSGKHNMTIEEYSYFMEKTGLFNLIENHITNNLYDYATGVETGLDSNGRKNRGGHLMEDLVESYLKKSGVEYYKEMYAKEAEKKFGIDLSSLSNKGKTSKRFDFVVKGKATVYGIECNFYSASKDGKGGGSKLNETARSYKMLATEAKEIDGFKFVWFTDGTAWNSARNNLRETFDVLDTLYNIKELEEGIITSELK